MFCPMKQVGGSGNHEAGGGPVKGSIGHTIDSFFVFHDAWVFAAAFPLIFLLGIVVGVEDGRRLAGKMEAVAAFGEPDTAPDGGGGRPLLSSGWGETGFWPPSHRAGWGNNFFSRPP